MNSNEIVTTLLRNHLAYLEIWHPALRAWVAALVENPTETRSMLEFLQTVPISHDDLAADVMNIETGEDVGDVDRYRALTPNHPADAIPKAADDRSVYLLASALVSHRAPDEEGYSDNLAWAASSYQLHLIHRQGYDALNNVVTIDQIAERHGISLRRARALAQNRHAKYGVGYQVPGLGQWLFMSYELEYLRPDESRRRKSP